MGIIFSLLKGVPLWVWALAALLTWGAWQKHRADSGAASHQAAIVQAAKEREQDLQKKIKITEKRVTEQAEIANNAASQVSSLETKRRANDVLVRGLRNQLSSLRAELQRPNPPAAAASAADAAADLLGQCAERYSAVAAEADRAIVAGRACQRTYDSLIEKDSK